ncbi:MAG: energy transducer TonB [Acidobacteriota bacterium]
MQSIITALVLSLLLFQSSGQGKKTEREFDEMNGPVRFVRVEVEDYRDQPGAPKTETRSFEQIVAYDVSGRVTEAIRGFGKDCVSSRHVFSYDAEGSRTQTICSGSALVAAGKSDPLQPPASPRIYKQVFKIDGAGRRSEIDEYDNTGKLSGKSFYKYDDQGRLNEVIKENYEYYSTPSRCEFKYNDKGLASEKKCQDWDFRGRERSHYAYEYAANGNWIRRTAKNSSVLPDGSVHESTRISYREFQYYSSKEDQAQPQPVGKRFDATKLAPCPPPPKIVRKDGGLFQGSATKRVVPEYPPDAQAARVFGSVVVEVTVNEVGRVISARAISGPVELREASVDAARRWEFTPTMLSGMPVKVIGTITFNFNL